MPFVLEALAAMYGRPHWEPRPDPVAQLVVTILSQNTSDLNADRAFAALKARYPSWAEVEDAPIDELVDTIRGGGLAPQKAPRIQATLRHIRERRGGYELDFLAHLPPLEARAWLTAIPGVGPKTAAVVLLFCFGLPLMPIDTHVERVTRRIGILRPQDGLVAAHDRILGDIAPQQVFEAHVNLITHGRRTCHPRNPACDRCLIAPRCRYVDPHAP
ncbi:MAG TPA: endonuclease III [Candidatus Limnocylindrales bacterium]|nr:endonuclease III [Candidatus Limnocylindrales bacterium]